MNDTWNGISQLDTMLKAELGEVVRVAVVGLAVQNLVARPALGSRFEVMRLAAHPIIRHAAVLIHFPCAGSGGTGVTSKL